MGADTLSLKIKLVSSFIISVLRGVVSFFIPLSLAWLIKSFSDDIQKAMNYFWLLFALSLTLILLKFIRRFFLESSVGTLPINIKVQYYKKLFYQSYSWHLNNSSGFFLSALNQVCANLQRWLQKFPDEYIPNTVLGILFFATFLIIIISVATLLYKYRVHIVEKLISKQIVFDKTFIDFLNNIRSIKKMGLLEFSYDNINNKKNDVAKQQEYSARYNGLQWGFIEGFMQLLFLIPIGYFTYQMIKTGDGVDIIVLLTSVQAKVGLLVQNIMHFMENVSETYVQYDILENHLEKISPNNKKHYKWSTISFKNTKFEFKKQRSKFIHSIPDFTIHKGDHIAVIGKSGEGKSTFLNILAGLLMVQSGETKVDNKTFQKMGEAFFSSVMSYISQDVELFDMTLLENITLGRHISKKELYKVINGVCLDELVKRANGNLDINIGEKGIKVSAGEKQRLNLARGLLLNKDILILDEITANLDAETTKKIWNFISG